LQGYRGRRERGPLILSHKEGKTTFSEKRGAHTLIRGEEEKDYFLPKAWLKGGPNLSTKGGR